MTLLLMLNLFLSLVALILLIPIGVLFVECMAALLPIRRFSWQPNVPRPKIAVLVPAHNEAIGIVATLQALLPQLTQDDRLLVVADNCDDETATLARMAGATVIERHNLEQRGKGYALDFGIQFLTKDSPDAVVIVDADCDVAMGAIEKIARLAVTTNRPVQATYLLTQPAKPTPKNAVSVLAFTVKNLVRPAGMLRLGIPNLLTGTGMALPWTIVPMISLASGNIVEDMQLGLDLAIAGHPPTFCAEAKVMGALPQQNQAATTQRTRWEHGHLQTLLTQVPRLLQAGLKQRRFDLLAIALDLLIPPLSLLVLLWVAGAIVMMLATLLGASIVPVSLLGLAGFLLVSAILSAWAKFCQRELPLQTLLSIPLYILWKIPLYLSFLVKPQTKWVRTERDVIDAPKS